MPHPNPDPDPNPRPNPSPNPNSSPNPTPDQAEEEANAAADEGREPRYLDTSILIGSHGIVLAAIVSSYGIILIPILILTLLLTQDLYGDAALMGAAPHHLGRALRGALPPHALTLTPQP